MATAKKAASKKTTVKSAKTTKVAKPAKTRAAVTTKKSPVVKKTTARKATSAKRVGFTKKFRKASKNSDDMKSFRVAKEPEPFMSFRITRQTVYWVVLVAFIVFAQLWILDLQVEVASLLDAQQASLEADSF
jgi:hypothetical protein